MVYTNYMNQDSGAPNTSPQTEESTVFQRPTSGFVPTKDEAEILAEKPVSQTYVPPQNSEVVSSAATSQEQRSASTEVNHSTATQPPEAPPQSADTQNREVPQSTERTEQGFFPESMRPVQEEGLYAWKAASRPFKKHNRNYYTTVAVIVLLVALILVFAGQFLPMAVVLAVAFMAYVLHAIPPQEIIYQITTFGIRIGDNLYYWETMSRFWYTEKFGERVLNVEINQFPDRLSLVVGDAEEKILSAILAELLLEQQPPPTVYEKMATWLQEKFPLDLDS